MGARLGLLQSIAAGIGCCLLLGSLGATLDRWDELAAAQASFDDAQAQAQASARRDAAARHLCGPHAAARWISDTEVACRNNGSKTRIARIAKATTGSPP